MPFRCTAKHLKPNAMAAARDDEAEVVKRCAAAARDAAETANDQREANVFRMAAMVVGQRFRQEARRLLHASDDYFAAHPEAKLAPIEVVRRGWVTSLPRLRERLTATLSQ